ncbi:hypothetical protein ACWICO_09275 [Glutamicibacter sp. NPDC055491]
MSTAKMQRQRRKLAMAAIAGLVTFLLLAAACYMTGFPTSAAYQPTPTPDPTVVAPMPPQHACQDSPRAEGTSSPGDNLGMRHSKIDAQLPRFSRVVNVGFEDITAEDPDRIPEIARRLNSVRATGVSLSIGRLDWVAFPWPAQRDVESSEVTQTGRDYVAEAISAFRCDEQGRPRTIYLNIDTLLGRELERRPSLAGINSEGHPSKNWASISAWKEDGLDTRLVELVSEAVRRYAPDGINVTELMFPSYTFGEDDLENFAKFSERPDWPRSADGTIDSTSEQIYLWRSNAVTSIMKKVAGSLDETGPVLTMDVRSPANGDPRGRPDSGQDYGQLLNVVDRLNIWNFRGIASSNRVSTDELVQRYMKQEPEKYSLEIGLWEGAGSMDSSSVSKELLNAEDHSLLHVSVTPTSLMDDSIWSALEGAWSQVPATRPDAD